MLLNSLSVLAPPPLLQLQSSLAKRVLLVLCTKSKTKRSPAHHSPFLFTSQVPLPFGIIKCCCLSTISRNFILCTYFKVEFCKAILSCKNIQTFCVPRVDIRVFQKKTFVKHSSVSSTYPCQSVRKLVRPWYFWIPIALKHFCATFVFNDSPK